jgi:uncharacterized protein
LSEPRKLRKSGLALRLGLYIALFILAGFVLTPIFAWAGGFFAGITISTFLSAALANSLAMRIWEDKHLAMAGFPTNRDAAINLLLGFGGGAGSAALVILPALALGAARLNATPQNEAGLGPFLFLAFLLALGSAGEELLFRGYGFQLLLRSFGAYAAVVPTAAVFAAMHANNPDVSPLGLINTAGFGIVFGYAFLRSHDLWLPIGLHFGWNFTLPLLGVNVSGFTMRLTNYSIEWKASALVSGGNYGPEASVVTTVVLGLLWLYLWKAPVKLQYAPLLEAPAEA